MLKPSWPLAKAVLLGTALASCLSSGSSDHTEPDASEIDVELEPNEASGLLPIESSSLLAALGWDDGFWVALDERVDDDDYCLAVVGGDSGDLSSWQGHRIDVSDGRPDDSEALARLDGFIYVLGSHYGRKRGPLQTKRHFVARFREGGAAFDGSKVALDLEVVMDGFRIHRLVNDALKASGVPIRAATAAIHRDVVAPVATPDGPVRPDDWPINVEGAAFLEGGALVLGLRYPVSDDGNPLLVELFGVPSLFDDSADELRAGRVAAVRVDRSEISQDDDEPRPLFGVRALSRAGETLHLVVGNLDSQSSESVVAKENPGGSHAVSQHLEVPLPLAWGESVAGEKLCDFEAEKSVEGLCRGPGGLWYHALDEGDRIRILPESP